MIDWNWFFSSLAQSSAAIIGILGAFLVSKILNNQAIFLQKKNKCQSIIIDCKKVADAANDRYFGWYNKYTNERVFEKLQDLLSSGEYLSPQEYYDQLHFSIFSPHQEIKSEIKMKIEQHKNIQEQERNESLKRAEKFGKERPGVVYIEPVYPKLDIPRSYPEQSKLNEEFDLISICLRDAKYQVRLVSNILMDIEKNPESSKLVNAILIFICFLFFFGVIYPLGFLPVQTNSEINITFDLEVILSHIISIKGFFLFVLSLVFSVTLIFLFLLNRSLKYPMEILDSLRRFEYLSEYSDYFRIMEENEKFCKK